MKKCARKGLVSSAEELYKFSPKPEDHPFILMVGLNMEHYCCVSGYFGSVLSREQLYDKPHLIQMCKLLR